LVYSCSDGTTIVVISAQGNPASPFVFTLTRTDQGYQVDGEGNGDRAASDAAGHDLSALTSDQIAALIADTRATTNSGSNAPRSVFVTTDSAPGWTPTIDEENAVTALTQRYLAAKDAGQYADAYAMLDGGLTALQPLSQFQAAGAAFNTQAGTVIDHRILRITWTKDPAQAPRPGIYAAVDIASRYANVDRDCGYLVLYQAHASDPFSIVREENNFLTNASAAAIEQQRSRAGLDQLWMQLSANCPNYSSH
jgi:hypothetical protein